jgi:hypothetical protein
VVRFISSTFWVKDDAEQENYSHPGNLRIYAYRRWLTSSTSDRLGLRPFKTGRCLRTFLSQALKNVPRLNLRL